MKKLTVGIVIGFCLGVSSLVLTSVHPTEQQVKNYVHSLTFNRQTDVDDLNVKEMKQLIRDALRGCKVQGTEIYGVYELNFNCPWE